MENRTRWCIALLVMVVAAGLMLGVLGWSEQQLHQINDPAQHIEQAWKRVLKSGAYSFSSDIIQIYSPLALVENVGRQSRQDEAHMEGYADLPRQRLEFTMWSNGGSVLKDASGVQIEVEKGIARYRQGDQAWQPLDDFSSSFAPAGDFLGFLSGAENVQLVEEEQASSEVQANLSLEAYGVEGLVKYTFTLNGEAYARYATQKYEEALRSLGKLPPGMKMKISQGLSQTTGWGEIWLDEAGYPRYQVLTIAYPPDEKSREEVSVKVVSALWGFGGAEVQQSSLLAISGLAKKWQAALYIPALLVLMFLALRKRTAHALLAAWIILSMLLGPLAQSVKAAEVSEEFSQQQDRQQAQIEVQQRERQAVEKMYQPEVLPNVSSLLETQTMPEATDAMLPSIADIQQAGSNPEFWVVPGLESPLGMNDTSSDKTEASVRCNSVLDHPEIDSDKDGLSDCQEHFLGTYPDLYDSDRDTITDTLEVQGFEICGKLWYGDPNQKDTNKDGISDQLEWGRDTDKDCIPDLWSRDNDGDKVPDDLDLSPFDASIKTVFNQKNPLYLTLENLTPGKITTIDFQLRPTNAEHLNYAFNVFRWPKGDIQGQVMDYDGKTFKDVEKNSKDPKDSHGNVRLVPVLEIRIPNRPGNPTSLPDEATRKLYGLMVSDPNPDHSELMVYVPLSLVTDRGEMRVAFGGRMAYLPMEAWGEAHAVRVAWIALGLVDLCKEGEKNWDKNSCKNFDSEKMNQHAPLVVYYEDFTITGMHVREDHGVDWALLYKDPSVIQGGNIAAQINQIRPMSVLAFGLEHTFLAGRVITDAEGIPHRDLNTQEIQRRFDHSLNLAVPISPTRFGIADNVLSVKLFSYAHLDIAMTDIVITETKQILDQSFTNHWSASQPITPTIMSAREERFRKLNLESISEIGNITVNGSHVKFNLASSVADGSNLIPVPVETMAGISWAPYMYQEKKWVACPLQVYLDHLEKIYPLNEVDPDSGTANGAMFMFRLFYMNMYQGAARIIEIGNHIMEDSKERLEDGKIAFEIISHFKEGFSMIFDALFEWKLKELFHSLSPADWKTVAREIANNINAARQAAAAPGGNAPLPLNIQEFISKMERIEAFEGVVTFISLGIGIVMLIITIIATALGQTGATWFVVLSYVFMAIMLALLLIKVISAIIKIVTVIKTFISLSKAWTFFANQTTFLKAFKQGMIVAAIVAAIELIALIIFLSVQGLWGTVAADIAGSMVLADIIASVLMVAIAAIPVVGWIIALILMVLDNILSIFGINLGHWIAEFLLGVDLLQDLSTKAGNSKINLGNRDVGFREGNTLDWSFTLTSTVTHKDPDSWQTKYALKWGFMPYNRDSLRKNSSNYKLDIKQNEVNAEKGEHFNRWATPVLDHYYKDVDMYRTWMVDALKTSRIPLGKAGINQDVKAFLNNGYSLQVSETWMALFVPVNVVKSVEGNDSESDEKGEILVGVFDIFPATLDELYSWQWDTHLRAPMDHDNDGLISKTYHGNDPDDRMYDTDGDGLSDYFEITMRSKPKEKGGKLFDPLKADTDGDGLGDYDELLWDTDPASGDTDGDGISDYEEVLGYAFTYGKAPDGTPLTTFVYSNPVHADGDFDGINDKAERLLHQLNAFKNPYKPDVWNENPLFLHISRSVPEGYVVPGQDYMVTASTGNHLLVPVGIEATTAITSTAVMDIQKKSDGPFWIGPGDLYEFSSDVHVQDGIPSQKVNVSGRSCGNLLMPVASLSFEETGANVTSFADQSGNQHHATCTGGGCPYAGQQGAPNSGYGLWLASGHSLELQNSSNAMNFQDQPFSLAAWVMVGANQGGGVIGKQGIGGYVLGVTVTDTPRVSFTSKKGSITVCPLRDISLGFRVDQWNQITAMQQRYGLSPEIYVNGKLANHTQCSASQMDDEETIAEADTLEPVKIGHGSGYGDFIGHLDEVYAYDRLLTPGEIDLMAHPPATLEQEEGVEACSLVSLNSITVTVDADIPSSQITSLANNQFLYSTGVLVIGGQASDPTSYVKKVEVSVDGGAWQPAVGGATWAFAWDTSRTGRHTLRSRATDAVGHVETSNNSIVVYIDRTAPALSLNVDPLVHARVNPEYRLELPLRGSASDLCAGVESVEVLLQDDGGFASNGWQTAHIEGGNPSMCIGGASAPTHISNSWMINYLFPSSDKEGQKVFDASGQITVSVRAKDRLGNMTQPNRYLIHPVGLDNKPPMLDLSATPEISGVVSTSIVIGGVVTDSGVVASGVQAVDVAFLPAESSNVVQETVLLAHLDEPLGLKIFRDSSRRANHGGCMGDYCPQTAQSGKINLAAQFDGLNDRIDFGNNTSLQLVNQVSVGAWFNTSVQPVGFQNLAGKWTVNGIGAAYSLFWDGTGLSFGVRSADGVILKAGSGRLYHDGQWHHAVGVWDGQDLMLYVDGVQVASNHLAGLGQLANPTINFQVGANGTIPGDEAVHYYSGLVDEVAVFPKALTQNQVGALYRWGTVKWEAANVAMPGEVTSNWDYTIPADLEGYFSVLLRATDQFSNQQVYGNLWNAMIDTRAPQVAIVSTPASKMKKISCEATDLNLQLVVDGKPQNDFQCPCTVQPLDKTYYQQVSDWFNRLLPDTKTLYKVQPTCLVALDTPEIIKACDQYGHCSEVTNSTLPETSELTGLASVVVEPADRTVITSLDPFNLAVAAQSLDTLQVVTITQDSQVTAVFNFSEGAVTDTLTSTLWTPPLDWLEGEHIFQSVAQDWTGNVQTATFTNSVILDLFDPQIQINTLVLTSTHQVGEMDAVTLQGSASDGGGVGNVEISIDGSGWMPANFGNGDWQFTWQLGVPVDGITRQVTARVTDMAGRVAEHSAMVVVDLLAPSALEMTVSTLDSFGQSVLLSSGATIRELAFPVLSMNWEEAQDGSGITGYLAGFSEDSSPDPLLMAYIPPGGARSITQSFADGEVVYAHLGVLDSWGNLSWTTRGPIFFDAPCAPTISRLSFPVDGNKGNMVYRGWLEDSYALLGVERRFSEATLPGVFMSNVQELYFSWDSSAIRLAWIGGEWNGHGDLFIYMNSSPGSGTTQAYNPFESGEVTLPFTANWLVWVSDNDQAYLLRWNGSQWVNELGRTLAADEFLFRHEAVDDITDVRLPFEMLGITDAQTNPLDLVAFVSDDEALSLLAIQPAFNPLNSSLMSGGLQWLLGMEPYTLENAYHWDSLAMGQCPAMAYPDVDIRAEMSTMPASSSMDSRHNGLLWGYPATTSSSRQPLANGQNITYTLTIQNLGGADAQNVEVRLQTSGALRLSEGSLNTPAEEPPYFTRVISVGDIPSGEVVSLSWMGDVEASLMNGYPELAESARLEAQVWLASGGESLEIERITTEHTVDAGAPEDLAITKVNENMLEKAYLRSGWNTLSGVVHDLSGVYQIEVAYNDPLLGYQNAQCNYQEPVFGNWRCGFNISAGTDGSTIELRARATDSLNNTSEWTAVVTLVLDTTPPQVVLDDASEHVLMNMPSGISDVMLSGMISDTHRVEQVMVCLSAPSVSLSPQVFLPGILGGFQVGWVNSSRAIAYPAEFETSWCNRLDVEMLDEQHATWSSLLAGAFGHDHFTRTIHIYALDAAGNLSEPLERQYSNDGRAPIVDVRRQLAWVSLVSYLENPEAVLAGNALDTSGVVTLIFHLVEPSGRRTRTVVDLSSSGWSYQPEFESTGNYRIYLEALDAAGNKAFLGPFLVEVVQ